MTELKNASNVELVLKDLRQNKMVIVLDNVSNTPMATMVQLALNCTEESINFMTIKAKGIISAVISQQVADNLALPLMVNQKSGIENKNYTVSIEAAKGVTTGISAYDRALTLNKLANVFTVPNDLSRPGHIFPLIARDKGLIDRFSLVEGCFDLMKLSQKSEEISDQNNHSEACVYCDILDDKGDIAGEEFVKQLGQKNDLKVVTLNEILQYRKQNEFLIEEKASSKMPTKHGDFNITVFQSLLDEQDYIALYKGEWSENDEVLVRVHSECLTGDILTSHRCDCGAQLKISMDMIDKEKKGVIVYLPQEGRGIGIINKIKAYGLQDRGADTVEANLQLGFHADLRDYASAAQILKHLNINKIKLITNNPKKIDELSSYSLKVVERVPIETLPLEHNKHYLQTKKDKMGHLLNMK